MSDQDSNRGNGSSAVAVLNASLPPLQPFASAAPGTSAVGLPVETQFRGSFPNAYRIDADGTLRYADAAYPSGTQFVDSSKIASLRIRPKWLNVPDQIFDHQDKVQAFLRLRVSQDDVQQPMKSPLSWSGIYSLLTQDHENLNPSHSIGSGDETQGSLDGIVLPNGTGELGVLWWAVIGPAAKTVWTIWDSTWQRLLNIANNQVESAVLRVPAASLAAANEVEELLAQVVLAFDRNATQQRWITDDNPTPLQFANGTGSGNGQTIVVPANARTTIILVPDTSQDGDKPQIDKARQAGSYPQLSVNGSDPNAYSYSDYLIPYLADGSKAKKFSLSGSGEVTADGDNPFAFLPYVAIELVVNATNTPNQGDEARTFSLSSMPRTEFALTEESAATSIATEPSAAAATPAEAPLPKTAYCTSQGGLFYTNPNDARVTTEQDLVDAVVAMDDAIYGKKTADAITFFFHGGLVGEDSGYATAQSLIGPYGTTASADVPQPGGSYPYFFVYETGIWSALYDVAPNVIGSAFFKNLVQHFVSSFEQIFPDAPPAIRSMALPMTHTNVTNAQIDATIKRIQRDVSADPEINLACEGIAAYQHVQQQRTARAAFAADAVDTAAATVDPVARYMDPHVRADIAADVEQGKLGRKQVAPRVAMTTFDLSVPSGIALLKDVAEIGWRVAQRKLSGHDHGLMCTIVEEIVREMFLDALGFQVWKDMKNDADAACTGNGVAATMIRNLDERFWSKGRFPRIVLIGHSEGTHFVARWLQAVETMIGGRYGENLKFDVIFMAAAVRTDILADVLNSSAKSYIQRYRTFAMHDAVESQDQLLAGVGLGWLYPRSLLYYISGVLEHTGETGDGTDFPDCPLVGMERFLDGNYPFTPAACTNDVSDVVSFLNGHLVLSHTDPSATEGWQCQAIHHGGGPQAFPIEPETLRSCAYLISSTNWR